MANEQNLTPWTKGVSGNPNGRPAGSLNLATKLMAALELEIERTSAKTGVSAKKKNADWIIASLINKASTGDVSAIKEVFDRVDGKVSQTIVKEGNPEAPLHSMILVRDEGSQEIYERFKKDLLEKEKRKNGLGDEANPEEQS